MLFVWLLRIFLHKVVIGFVVESYNLKFRFNVFIVCISIYEIHFNDLENIYFHFFSPFFNLWAKIISYFQMHIKHNFIRIFIKSINIWFIAM